MNASSAFARVPIEYDPTLAGKQYGHYLFNYSSVSYTNGTTTGHNDTSIQVVADSGAPTISLPAHLAKEINAMFDPPAELVDGAYIVGCDAKAPRVSFEIGGHDFSIYPPDLIYHAISNTTAKADSGYAVHCASAVQADSSGSGGFSILGEPFLKNVLGVFDWGSHEIRFVLLVSLKRAEVEVANESQVACAGTLRVLGPRLRLVRDVRTRRYCTASNRTEGKDRGLLERSVILQAVIHHLCSWSLWVQVASSFYFHLL